MDVGAPWWRRLAGWQLGRYALAAGIATVADSILFLIIYQGLDGVPPYNVLPNFAIGRELWALTISYPAGVWIHYEASRAFVFRSGEGRFSGPQLRRFLLASAVVFVLNHWLTLLLLYLVPLFTTLHADTLAFSSRTVASVSIGGISYLLHRYWTFRGNK